MPKITIKLHTINLPVVDKEGVKSNNRKCMNTIIEAVKDASYYTSKIKKHKSAEPLVLIFMWMFARTYYNWRAKQAYNMHDFSVWWAMPNHNMQCHTVVSTVINMNN